MDPKPTLICPPRTGPFEAGAAISSFLAFSVGAVLPLLPFLFSAGPQGIAIAAAIAGVALFIIGAVLSLFSDRNAFIGGGRMLLIGAVAAGRHRRHRRVVQHGCFLTPPNW
ncbi:VIT1/CCC1 transporter family protein [Ancylobacter novellus]|uniref:VIT1/CCC1 transporter family protein n=1 Tax=Ancylobacter novellus TaxID=921 RepID=UPI0009D65984